MEGELVVFLVEEESMEIFLREILNRLGISEEDYKIVVFEGKHDLKKRFPIKLRSWFPEPKRFFLLIDNDNIPDCTQLKAELLLQCIQANRADTIIRIVCQELETWYLGNLEILVDYYKKPLTRNILKQVQQDKRKTDTINKPAMELEQQFPAFRKVDIARHMGKNITLEGNSSISFGYFVQALKSVFPCLPPKLETP